MKFENLLYKISSKFINLSASEVDQEINAAIRMTVEFLRVDQCVFGEFKEGDTTLRVSHGYTSHQWPEPPGLILNSIAPNIIRQLHRGEVVNMPKMPRDLPVSWKEEKAYAARVGLKSCVGVSLKAAGSVLGVIIFESYREHKKWTEESLQHMRLLAQIFSSALERKQADIKLREAFNKIQELSERLKEENLYLRETISNQNRYENVIGRSEAIQLVLKKIERVAETHSTVLLLGETGTGKTLFAHLIHSLSKRKNKTMVKVNCATLPANLLENELFGHEKGAFTGAVSRETGRFEIAHNSTLFLDEIGELSVDLQAKLLKVLDEGEFERLGNARPIRVNVRIVAATNRDIDQMVKKGTFRSDLYYRLSVYPVHIPPLRQRREDIPEMVWAFVQEFCKTMGRNVRNIPEKSMKAMMNYSWPGNIRELKNVIENAMISSRKDTLDIRPPENALPCTVDGMPDPLSHDNAERAHIINILKNTSGRVKGIGGAADILMLKPSTLYSKMKKLNIIPGFFKG